MLSRIFFFTLCLVAPTLALPAIRNVQAGGYPIVSGDNGSCQKMGQLCAAQIGDNYDSMVANGEDDALCRHPGTEETLGRLGVSDLGGVRPERDMPADVLQRHRG